MISRFVREQNRYTQKELCEIFSCRENEVIPIIRRLKEFGVLKAVRASDPQRDMSELIETDIEVKDVEPGDNQCLEVVTCLGVIAVCGMVLKCYPKYMLTQAEPVKELAQVIKVLERYNSKEQIVHMFNDSSEGSAFNLLSVLLFLLQDYYENGIYSNTEDVIETNGMGEILWDRTINETFTLISGNRPYYMDLQTKRRMMDEYDYFKRLHECILTTASTELRDAGLTDIFGVEEIELSEQELDDFGDRDTILYNLEKELRVQFITRKQRLLKVLYAYVAQSGSLYEAECFSLFGTNSFNLVWEDVCAAIMDNQLDTELGALPLPMPLKDGYDKKMKLIDLIEKPLWSAAGKTAKDTLIPDLVSIAKINQEMHYIIFDAKYYNAKLEMNCMPKGQPGIESITKQYLYQLAYKGFIKDHGFAGVRNCFLMPTEEETVIDKGEVSMQMLSELELQNIKVRFLPAKAAYECYLAGRHMDIAELKL